MYINNIFEDRFQQVVIERILKNLNFFVTHLLRRPSSPPLPKYSLCCPPQTWAWTTTTRTSRFVEARSSPLSLSALLLSAHLAPRALSWKSHSRRCRMSAGMFLSLGVLRLACPPLQTCLQEDQAPWGLALWNCWRGWERSLMVGPAHPQNRPRGRLGWRVGQEWWGLDQTSSRCLLSGQDGGQTRSVWAWLGGWLEEPVEPELGWGWRSRPWRSWQSQAARLRSHFLGEDPPDPLTVGNSPKARHRAGVIADQKTTRGKTGAKWKPHIYAYSTIRCTEKENL